MPTLLRQTADGWQLADNDETPVWQQPEQWQPGDALTLSADAEPQPAFARASAIAIDFPAFTDGRGLSLAVLIRTRLRYGGELRATGGLHEELLHYMVRCGFDALELPDNRDARAALAQLTPYTDQYQASVTQPQPAFRRVNRGCSA